MSVRDARRGAERTALPSADAPVLGVPLAGPVQYVPEPGEPELPVPLDASIPDEPVQCAAQEQRSAGLPGDSAQHAPVRQGEPPELDAQPGQ